MTHHLLQASPDKSVRAAAQTIADWIDEHPLADCCDAQSGVENFLDEILEYPESAS
jgi:hypothetical protein